jgi:uncharacterized membrane protein
MAIGKKLAVSGGGIAIGVILIVAVPSYFMIETSGSGHGHWMTGEESLSTSGWIAIIVGIVVILLSVVYLVIPPRAQETRSVTKLYPDLAVISVKDKEALTSDIPPGTQHVPDEGPTVSFEQMALRLLEGDERRVYRKVVEAGGEVLQKDIVAAVPFSKAKVSRIIDKLEEKGLISKVRHGYTNKIMLAEGQ